MLFNEDFIHYLWKFRLLNPDLKTEAGESLVVLHPGEHNRDGGPDFFNARILIGETTWAGNVEIHVRASDWYHHNHHTDPAYENTILHVVFEADRQAETIYHNWLPTLKVDGQFPPVLMERYREIMRAKEWLPCATLLPEIPLQTFTFWAPVLALERIAEKSTSIRALLASAKDDWEEAFYRYLAICFGFKVNALPFELLAKALPLKYVRPACDNLFRLEALFFGQAGMLNRQFKDNYAVKLSAEYVFQREKYNLEPVSPGTWKFLRMRPTNFPTIRISQFSRLIYNTRGKLFGLVEGNNLNEVREMFNVGASAYWNDHFVFDKQSVYCPKMLGRNSVNLLFVNALAMFKFFYGVEKDIPAVREQALQFLELTQAEINHETALWKNSGWIMENALQSQALMHLKKCYCSNKRCLECRIGERILNRKYGKEN